MTSCSLIMNPIDERKHDGGIISSITIMNFTSSSLIFNHSLIIDVPPLPPSVVLPSFASVVHKLRSKKKMAYINYLLSLTHYLINKIKECSLWTTLSYKVGWLFPLPLHCALKGRLGGNVMPRNPHYFFSLPSRNEVNEVASPRLPHR